MKPSRRYFLNFFNVLLIINSLTITSISTGKAQELGQLSGMITDEASGEALVGVSILIVGTPLGASSDVDGKYIIRKIPFGTYDITVSSIGYSTKTITGVIISSTQPINLNINISQEAVNVNEVVVTANEVHSNETAVLSQRRKSSSISDGISSEQIKRAPDATSGDALKRVTGLSVVDNKFVYIRGITDRYNNTMLDGATVTSTEANKKGFSYDLLPSSLIENTSVVKSATPDLPGDFSGGLVQLNTLDIPSERVFKLSFSSSYNSVTTGNNVEVSQGGERDWLGFDDGIRAIPENQPDPLSLAKTAANTWAPRTKKPANNSSLSFSLGNTFFLSDEDQLGIISSLSYRNAYQRNEKAINDVEVGRTSNGTKDDYTVLWGGLLNLTYKFNGLHKISFKNNYNHSAEDNVIRYSTLDINSSEPTDNLFTVVNWTQRSIYTGQLTGEHNIPSLGGLIVEWRGSISSSRRDDPDRKQSNYIRLADDPSMPYTVSIGQRSWSFMNERSRGFNNDITLPLSFAKFKIGSLFHHQETNYNIRYFEITPDYFGGIPDSLTHLPLEVIYSPENYGRGKFTVGEVSRANDSYEGNQDLIAWYLMTDIPFAISNFKFRIVGGTRYEHSTQRVTVPLTKVSDGPVSTTTLDNGDFLPSLNFTYISSDNMNLRFAYSHSVNRPEFRELATTAFYDFVKQELVGGNPNLRRSLIKNYDVRFEFFPDAGELFAVSYFHKDITDAIEEQLVQTANRSRTPFNSDHAENTGWELEVRKSLKFLGGYFTNFSINGNYTRIQSTVEYLKTEGNSSNTTTFIATRPLQGQSPYMINLSLFFTEPTLKTSVSLLYNKFGSRLQTVGFLASDIYEEPRDLIDLSISQPLFGSCDAKFTIKNLNSKDQELTRGGLPYERTTTGRTFSLQFGIGL